MLTILAGNRAYFQGRRKILFLLLAFLSPSLLLAGPPPNRRIVALQGFSFAVYDLAIQGFRKALDESGSAFEVETLTLPQDAPREADFFRDLTADPPSLLLVMGSGTAAQVQGKVAGIPTVHCALFDPESHGVRHAAVTLDVRPSLQVRFIQKSFPSARSIAVIYNPANYKSMVQELNSLWSQGKASLVLIESPGIEGVDRALSSLLKSGADCLLMLSDPTLYTPATIPKIILGTLQRNIPIVTTLPAMLRAGAAAGVYSDPVDNGYQAGKIALRILAGESPESIPIQWSEKAKTGFNTVVAARIRVAISPSSLAEAEQIVK